MTRRTEQKQCVTYFGILFEARCSTLSSDFRLAPLWLKVLILVSRIIDVRLFTSPCLFLFSSIFFAYVPLLIDLFSLDTCSQVIDDLFSHH